MPKTFTSTLIFLFAINTIPLLAQNGYVVTKDSTVYGYLQFETIYMDGEQEILVWKARNSKKPIRFRKDQVIEYAYKKDTFRLKFDTPTGQTVLKRTKEKSTPEKGSSLGWGLGLDYGGIGMRATVWPASRIAFFGGAGYNLIDVGWNAGVNLKLSVKERVRPYLSFMYGYNATLKVTGGIIFSKVYYGPSAGFGLEFLTRNESAIALGFIVPFRSSAFSDDFDRLKKAGVDFSVEPIPITLSIGFHLY